MMEEWMMIDAPRCHFGPLSIHWNIFHPCLVVGANGIGKTSLFKILAQKNRSFFYCGFYQSNSYLNVETALEISIGKKARWLFDLKQFRKKSLRHLSAGQFQKFLLTIAFNQPDKVLLLDEPTVYLDIPSRETLLSLIQERRTHLWVSTHEIHFFQQSFSHVLKLRPHENSYGAMDEASIASIIRWIGSEGEPN